MIPYKNQNIDYTLPVKIYRCLNRKGYVFSIKQFGRVVAHSDNFVVKNCTLIVNEKIRDKIRLTKERVVHAYIKSSFSHELRYNPYTTDFFESNSKPIKHADIIYVDKKNNRLLCQ